MDPRIRPDAGPRMRPIRRRIRTVADGLTSLGPAIEPRPMDVTAAAGLLEALGNPTRLRIFIELDRAGEAGMSVGALQECLAIDAKSTLSNHLRQLVHAGLVTQERRSTTLLCRACSPPMADLIDFLRGIASSSMR